MRRAVLDFAMYRYDESDDKKELYAEVAGWLFSDVLDDPTDYAGYTFLEICRLLELSPNALREQALTLTREDCRRFSADMGND